MWLRYAEILNAEARANFTISGRLRNSSNAFDHGAQTV